MDTFAGGPGTADARQGVYLQQYVKLVPSPEADDVAVTSSQSLMPCRDR